MKKKLLFLSFFFVLYTGHAQFFEGFENTTGPDALPSTNWTLGSGNWQVFSNGAGAVRWTINNVISSPPTVYNGTNAAYMNRVQVGAGNTSENYLATPAITVPTNGKLSFHARTFTQGDQGTKYQIKYCLASSVPSNPASYILLQEYTETTLTPVFNSYEQKEINLPSSLYGTPIHIAFVRKHFQVGTAVDGDRWLLDDVRVSDACAIPYNLSTLNVMATSFDINWSQVSGITQWEVEVLPQTANPTGHGMLYSGTLPMTVTTTAYGSPLVQTPLTANLVYKYYVRSVCPNTTPSDWIGPLYSNTQLSPECGGIFTDPGVGGNYPNNTDETVTICPPNPTDTVNVIFTSFNTEATYDALYVYNGPNTSSPQIASSNGGGNVPGGLPGGYWGSTIPGPFTSTDATGCLTFRFRSDGQVARPGWSANIICGEPLKRFNLIAFLDSNNNGVKDLGEGFVTNGAFNYQINDSGVNTQIFGVGSYSFYDQNSANSYDFNFTLPLGMSNYSCNTIYTNLNPQVGVQVLYFPVTVIPHTNVGVALNSSFPRPGFTYINSIKYRNLGTTTVSGTLTFIKDPDITISAVSQSGTIANTDGFTYDYTNLLPGQQGVINVTLAVPPIPTVNLGDLLTTQATVTPTIDDNYLPNNSASNTRMVVGSYDPNDKSEAHGPLIQHNQFTANDYLYYTINFQNEGTAEALTVRIHDVLDSKLDETSIRMEAASHDYVLLRTGNQLEWKFDNINLPPQSADDALSKGYVLFSVKPKPGYLIGDVIPNTANIYFDTNPAIVTNTFTTTFVALDNTDFATADFAVYPNPADQLVHISNQNTNENISRIAIIDVMGKTVKALTQIDATQLGVDVSDLSAGLYLIEITTENNLKTTKKLIIN